MTEKEFIRAICLKCKEMGVRINKKQAKTVFKAFKEVAIDACKEEKTVRLRGFISVKGVKTRRVKLPNGQYNIPRVKMSAEVSDVLQRKFREDMKEED